MKKLLSCLFVLYASTAAAEFKIEPGKVKFCNSLKFDTCSNTLDPSQNQYVWFEFGKPVGAAFQQTFGTPTMPLNGFYTVFVSKNIDTDPIVQYAGPLLVNRWNQITSFVLTAQADEATMKSLEDGTGDAARLPQPFRGQMADVGFKDQFLEGIAAQDDGEQPWEIFLFFKPFNGGEAKEVMRGKFTYTLNEESRVKLATYMNRDTRAKFAREPDDGMKTALHKANVGKIVFGAKKLGAANEDASLLKSDFSGAHLKSGISAQLYLKESIRNVLSRIGLGKDIGTTKYVVLLSLDGKEFRHVPETLDGADARTKTTFALTLAPANKAEETDNEVLTHKFAYLVSTLAPGKHDIKLDAFVGGKGAQRLMLASGGFTLNVTAADRDAFAKAQGQQLPGKGDLGTDKAMLAQVRKMYGPETVAFRAPKVWENRFDAFRRLTHRVTILITGFKRDGECKMAAQMIEQPKTASGWGPVQLSATEKLWFSIDGDLPCQNLVKD